MFRVRLADKASFIRSLVGAADPIVRRKKQKKARSRADDFGHAFGVEALESRLLMASSPIGYVDIFNRSQIIGWALNQDSGAASITVRVTINGTSTDITANQPRADLTPVFGSPNHGFTFNVPALAPGSHSVLVQAINPVTNAPVTLKSDTLINPAPIGSVDILDTTRVYGWGFDQDAGANPVQIRIDNNGQTLTTITANQSRADLAAGLGDPNHAFFYNSGVTLGVVDVWVLDNPTSTPVLLKSNNNAVIGSLDVLNAQVIAGWAFDPDRPNAAVRIQVDVDGQQFLQADANAQRPDLAGYIGSTAHGYVIPLTGLPPGPHTITVYALDTGTTSNTKVLLGTGAATNPPPFGSIDIASRDTVAGWAFDSDAGGAPLQVQIRVDNVVKATVTANQARADLTPGLGSPNHGYYVNLSGLAEGPHRIALWGIDAPSGQAYKIAEKIIDNTLPIGSLDLVRADLAAGWAFDPNSPGEAVQVVYELDGVKYPAVTANSSRPDLAGYIGSANHGFATAVPTHLFGSHTLRAFAIDTFSGEEVLLGTKQFANNPPAGSFDVATSTVLAGWVYDPDVPTKTIDILVRVDGTSSQRITAGQNRPDLTPYIGSANHGFTVAISGLSPGTHLFEIFGIDPATGVTQLIGTKNVTA